ncbi:MAG TPA: efflux RND transporter periplasmic adaptor subunit [Bryobacteraceae bacterium]|nr:efflux RND transporter periplasmic adaptor subunit [Bryobacteraceae bacterium]
MSALEFLGLWAVRSSALTGAAAILLWALRVKDPAARLAAWTAVLCASLALPALTAGLPRLAVAIPRATSRSAQPAAIVPSAIPQIAASAARPAPANAARTASLPPAPASNTRGVNLASLALALYAAGALALLLRLAVGIALTLRLLNRSRATGRTTEGIEIRESAKVTVPVALGVFRPAIALPEDWREWEAAKLEAVLAHERAHIRRGDPAVQMLSALHRALLWHSPLSWLLHARLVRTAEDASDDAALAVTRDRAAYAEVVLEFVRRTAPQRTAAAVSWMGAPMARYGHPEERIQRILDGTSISRGLTRWGLAAVLAIGSPLVYLAAAATPQAPGASRAPAPPSTPASAAAAAAQTPKPPAGATSTAEKGRRKQGAPAHLDYIAGLGQVMASATVAIHPSAPGQLQSVSFKEGETVKEGQHLASVAVPGDAQDLQLIRQRLASDVADLARAETDLQHRQQLGDDIGSEEAAVAQAQRRVADDRVLREKQEQQVSRSDIRSPLTGLSGLLQISPGNMVRPDDTIVVITKVQPIYVVFTIPEDRLFEVRSRLAAGAALPVEAWNRDSTEKIATGRLIAVDNQIDPQTGTAKLKAEFENADGALFPNQFVNARLFLPPR